MNNPRHFLYQYISHFFYQYSEHSPHQNSYPSILQHLVYLLRLSGISYHQHLFLLQQHLETPIINIHRYLRQPKLRPLAQPTLWSLSLWTLITTSSTLRRFFLQYIPISIMNESNHYLPHQCPLLPITFSSISFLALFSTFRPLLLYTLLTLPHTFCLTRPRHFPRVHSLWK